MPTGYGSGKSLSITTNKIVIASFEYYAPNNIITSLKPFDDVDGVMLIYDKYELMLKDDKKLLLVSWVGDFKKENKIIAENKDNYDILVFHTELSGMTYDNNRTIINGINLIICFFTII